MKIIAKLKHAKDRLFSWINSHRKIAFIISAVLAIAIGGLTTFLILQKPKTTKVATIKKSVTVTKPVEAIKYYSPLTGSLVSNQTDTKKAVTGIMIENSPNARPQSGLKNSGVVFEAIAEGGITRFLVLYQQEKPQIIGPVRSVRLYDVDWLAAFDASLAHVGGSSAALTEVRNGTYRDIDQFFNAGTYWRSTDRYAPHNVYTSFERIDALNIAKGYKESNFTGFSRADGKASATPDATNIDIVISSELYNSTYTYDKKTNTYARNQADEPHLDRESGQITPSVVIAMRVNETTVMEDGYRQSITTTGSGSAVIFQNGTATQATWYKADKKSQIKFTDDNGKEIPLVRGQTWIAAVPNDGGDVTWK